MGLKRMLAVLAAALAACNGGSGDGAGTDAGHPSSSDAGTQASAYEITVLDPAAAGEGPLAIATSGTKIGVAYFAEVAGGLHEIRYVEPGGTPEVVAKGVKNTMGVSLALDSAGNPHVAYLGGAKFGDFWAESDLAVASKSGGAWNTEIVVTTSDQAPSTSMNSNYGDVVGVWPAIAVGAQDKLFVAYRDVHGGQFPVQDYQHADVELAEGKPGAWTPTMAVPGGDRTEGFGGYNSIAIGADGEPAVAFSTMPNSPSESPQDVWFTRRKNGKWSAPDRIFKSGDVHAGAVLVANPSGGFGLAVEDKPMGVLEYLESADGVTWNAPDPVFGSGTGGGFGSLAYDPDSKSPVVAFYVCSTRPLAQTCPAEEDELRVSLRRTSDWSKQTVDAEGGYWPRVAYSGNTLVVAYKDVNRTVLKLARSR